MKAEDYEKLLGLLKEELVSRPPDTRVAIVGRTPIALDLVRFFLSGGLQNQLAGVYADDAGDDPSISFASGKPLRKLKDDGPPIVIIASDEHKEALLESAIPYLAPTTRVLIGGFSHFGFRDLVFEQETANPLVPSFANGYPNSLIHIYQCLQNAARLKLRGVVAEFGMFKGGTTMLISRFVERLGQDWKVYGFDTFGGFPEPRSALDMYAHPDCFFTDEASVRRFFSDRNVEIISGDLVETASHMRGKDVVLAFVDTDNYSSAMAILDAIQDRVVRGGAIIFDHFTGRDRFLFTLGERFAAKRLLADPRYFNLHDTGVFWRQA